MGWVYVPSDFGGRSGIPIWIRRINVLCRKSNIEAIIVILITHVRVLWFKWWYLRSYFILLLCHYRIFLLFLRLTLSTYSNSTLNWKT